MMSIYVLHAHVLLFSLQAVHNIKPQVGGVLGGGGEAAQYFIVCENKPLFKV